MRVCSVRPPTSAIWPNGTCCAQRPRRTRLERAAGARSDCRAGVRSGIASRAGWALKTRDDNSCGRYMHRESFGHTGFVGTCVWADPREDVAAVLLTNSVYFGRSDTRNFRAAFYEAAMTAVTT